MEYIKYNGGYLFISVEWIQATYGAAMVRVNDIGEVELYVDQDGWGWVNITELEPMSSTEH